MVKLVEDKKMKFSSWIPQGVLHSRCLTFCPQPHEKQKQKIGDHFSSIRNRKTFSFWRKKPSRGRKMVRPSPAKVQLELNKIVNNIQKERRILLTVSRTFFRGCCGCPSWLQNSAVDQRPVGRVLAPFFEAAEAADSSGRLLNGLHPHWAPIRRVETRETRTVEWTLPSS